MTDQEIEKLREKLGDEFEVTAGYNCAVITVKDIWKGVDFYEDHLGAVRPISESFRKEIKSGIKFLIHPSTESAYVEQLKAKAMELYGEIEYGQKFDASDLGLGNELISFRQLEGCEFNYCKEDDSFQLGGFRLYQKGKWAKRIPKTIVTPIEIHSEEPDIVGDQHISIRMKIIHGHISPKNRRDVAYHLAKCLEDYLNKS